MGKLDNLDYIQKKLVETFNLKDEADRELYQSILNDPLSHVMRDEFTYDKTGTPLITVWYLKADNSD